MTEGTPAAAGVGMPPQHKPLIVIEKPLNIHQRMNRVMRDVERVFKGSTNKHHKYKFASHDEVTDAIRHRFVEHGIVQEVTMLSCNRWNIEGTSSSIATVQVRVRWVNMDNRDDHVEAQIWSDSQPGGTGGPTPQQIGAALSYGVKMLQLKNFALIGDDEDTDGQTAGTPAIPVVAATPTPFQFYAAGFANVQTGDQLSDLMKEITPKRETFSKSEIEQLTVLWQQTTTRLLAAGK